MKEWLLLSYKVPSEPSSKRVAVWRKIRGYGAIYIQNGVCVLPKSEKNQRQFKMIKKEITDMEGEALLLETTGLDEKEEEHLITRFNEERNAHYQEFIGKCNDYMLEIKTETENKHFTYPELQENDEDLKKLKDWLEKIVKLDYFGAPMLAEAQKNLLQCEQILDEFAQQVFNAEGQ